MYPVASAKYSGCGRFAEVRMKARICVRIGYDSIFFCAALAVLEYQELYSPTCLTRFFGDSSEVIAGRMGQWEWKNGID